MKLSEIDKNLKVETTLKETDIVWTDLSSGLFDVYGLYDYQNQIPYRRMPADIADRTNDGVKSLNYNTSGGRVRFTTDSPYIAVHLEYANERWNMPHMPTVGSAGIDLYCDSDDGFSEFRASFMPDPHNNFFFDSILYPFEEACECSYTLNLPLYASVKKLEIGLRQGSQLLPGKKYKFETPVVFYGSSITQGAAASRPGNCYTNMLSRLCDTDILNLGFSGSAKGEEIIANYIASLKMSAFVYDYDHNSPSPEALVETHEKFFRIIRDAQPELPILMISRPDFDGKNVPDNIRRRHTVYSTFKKAVEGGDRNVYYIDGERLFEGFMRDACTVDNCHPNDLGFYRMTETVYPILKRILCHSK